MPSSQRLRAWLEAYFDLAREIEEFLDRFHEAVQLVVTIRVVVNDFEPLAEMRERIDIVRRVSLAVALDIFDHLAPHPALALDFEIDLLEIDIRDLFHVLQIENFELQNKVAGFAVSADADPELGVDKTKPAELFLVRCHLGLERLEIFGRRKTNRHKSAAPLGSLIN